MSVISIAIQKGGSGKTTTALNLAAALHRKGYTLLLMDADPQANLSQSLGILTEPKINLCTELKKEMLGKNGDLQKAIIQTQSGLLLIPASIELAAAEVDLASIYGREQVFRWLLEPLKNQYDYIFIDCPPSIGMLTINALVASDYVLMPLLSEFLPLKGIHGFLHHFKSIKNNLNKSLEILGYVLTRYDERMLMNRHINQELTKDFGEKTFHTKIRTNIQLAKAQEVGVDIFSFEKRSHGAEDYQKLAEEFLEKIGKDISPKKELTQ